MAAASSPRAAPATVAANARRVLRPALPLVATAIAVAAVMWLVYDPWYLNYDARYALLWAHDLAHGLHPDYTADFAPTPHPLQTASSILALPFGSHADDVVALSALLCFGALGYVTYRLGSELFTPAAGVVAALVVLTRPALQRDAVLAYQDVAFAALVAGAVLLEARQRRRGLPVLAVLAVAGLVRPDAWALAGLYWLYLWPSLSPRRRLAYAGIVAAAPVLWACADWWVTGDPLHSLHGTAALAEEADRRRHLRQVPFWTAQYLGFTLREPVIIALPIGLFFAWRYRLRQAILPLAAAATTTAVFAIGPVFGLPLIGRYVRTPSVLLALFYGLAVFGWQLLPEGRERK